VNLFGLSPGELLLIMMVAMVVLGPEKLPEVAASLGKWIREFRKATEELSAQFAGDNPLLDLQRALSLTDDPAPTAAVEEPAPEVVPDGVPAELAAPAALPVASVQPPSTGPVRGDYFTRPPTYPGLVDDWTHGSLQGGARRNGHVATLVGSIADEWTHGVPLLRAPEPASTGQESAASSQASEDGTPESAIGRDQTEEKPPVVALRRDGTLDLATPDVEEPAAAEQDPLPATDGQCAVLATPSPDVAAVEAIAVESVPPLEADGAIEETPPLPLGSIGKHDVDGLVAENATVNGTASQRADEAVAIPVPAVAGDSREGDRT